MATDSTSINVKGASAPSFVFTYGSHAGPAVRRFRDAHDLFLFSGGWCRAWAEAEECVRDEGRGLVLVVSTPAGCEVRA